jgi:hypothetical protein
MARAKELLDATADRALTSGMGSDDDEPVRNPELAQPQE